MVSLKIQNPTQLKSQNPKPKTQVQINLLGPPYPLLRLLHIICILCWPVLYLYQLRNALVFLRDYLGIFPKWPPFWEPLIPEKN